MHQHRQDYQQKHWKHWSQVQEVSSKRWIDNVKEDLQQRGSDIRQQSVSKTGSNGGNSSMQPVVGNLRVKTEESKEEED